MAVALHAGRKVADAQIVAVRAGGVLPGAEIGVCRDAAVAQLVRQVEQRRLDVPRKQAELLRTCKGVRPAPGRERQVLRRVAVLHGMQHGGIVEQQAGAAHRAGALFCRFLRREPAVGRDEHIARRDVEHACRHDLVPVALRTRALKCEQVQQHLQPHAIPHVRERERLAPGLVVDHAQVELAVVQPAVHAVGHAAHVERHLTVRERDRRDLLGVGEVELEIQRHEIARAQLVRHVGHHLPHLPAQAAEEVDEACGFLLKIIELVVDVALRPVVGEAPELLVGHDRKAAGGRRVLRRMLQDIVEERADLRRAERRRAAGLGLEPVLQKVSIAAGTEALGLRCREVQPLAVERAHALGREPAAGGVRRACERCERGGVVLPEPCARGVGVGVRRAAQRARS